MSPLPLYNERAREGKSLFYGVVAHSEGGHRECSIRSVCGSGRAQEDVSAWIQITDRNHTRKQTATFRTFTADLERLGKWLEEHQVNQVALESTTVFWIPCGNILERSAAHWKLTLINPRHVHALPGHKTDQKDCERIAELLQHGLLKGSFIPLRPIRELRDVTRHRAQGDRDRPLNRIRRLLETANFKAGSVVSDINGRTAQLILAAIVQGKCDPTGLTQLAKARLTNKKVELAASLDGFSSEHFRWLLSEAIQELADLDRKLEQIDKLWVLKTRNQQNQHLVTGRICTG
jgi:transposase